MRLTTFTDYSLRVLIYLAANPTRRTTIAEVARSFGVSEHHLVKVVHFLGKQGWLDNVRGKGGGLSLAVPPETIAVGSVVRQTEGRAILAECFEDGNENCAIADACRLRSVFGEALGAFYEVLDRYTLRDLVSEPPHVARILLMHRKSA